MQGRGFQGLEDQVQPQAAVLGLQVKFIPLKFRPPVVDPDLHSPRRRPGQTQGPPAGFLPKEKGAPGRVRDGQMGEIDGVERPGRTGLGVGFS